MKKITKIAVILSIVIISVVVILRIGSFMSHQAPVGGKFISQVGSDTHVYNMTQKEIGSLHSDYMWQSLVRGMPGFFQLWTKYNIKRIEILDINFDDENNCGFFHVNTYTRFNRLKSDNLRVSEPCP
ncbi:MAG: hypothetical protein GF349_02960 [Candidatus Magasanikbacteria bacterium]|nr:hypothetical protein [Candidatus Magasanikbacteria bacterium]